MFSRTHGRLLSASLGAQSVKAGAESITSPITQQVNQREVTRFAQVERVAQIPQNLIGYYSFLSKKTDSEQEAQTDFVELNKSVLKDPITSVRLT